MDQRATYTKAAQEAVERQDVDGIVRLIEDTTVPFWLRREGEEIAMESAEDEFAITVFNRLFLPIAKAVEGDALLLLEWWLIREERVAAPRRLAYLRRFLREAAAFPNLPDRLFNVALGVLADWTQKPNPLAGWAEANRVTRRFLATYGETTPSRLADPRMLRAALWSGDLGLMRAFAELGVKVAESADQQLMLHYIVGNLVNFSDKTTLRSLAEGMHAKDPTHPIAIHNLAQVYDAECRDAAEIAKLYSSIDEQLDPFQFRMTVGWMAIRCYDRGYKAEAEKLSAMLPMTLADGPREVGWSQKVLHDLPRVETEPLSVYPSLLGLEDLPPVLMQPLEQAARLAQGDMTWSAALTARALEQEFRGIVERIGAIPQTVPYLADCERAAQRLLMLSRTYFDCYRHFVDVSPVPMANKYGRVDTDRLRTACVGLNLVAAAVASIGLESILGGTPSNMERCLRLLDYYVGARLASRLPDEALALLERFQQIESCRDFVCRLTERCLLEKGEVSAAEALLTPDERQRSVVYAVVDRENWTQAEALAWRIAIDDPQSRGQFEVAWADGSVLPYDHIVPAVRLSEAKPHTLAVRRGEVLRGCKGLILRPQRLHYPFSYPERTPDIVACGERAVRLLRLGSSSEIAEPVVVLENFDALYHRNYYHWVVLVLTRANYVKTAGLLEGRRLLVPEGLAAWMLRSLEAIGVTDDEILIAPADVELCLTDALLISSVEFASPTLLRLLCSTILPPSEAADETEPPPHLYLSRRNQTRRPFQSEPEIEAIARDLGFTVVQPETLSFAEQARLFRSAACVAGPEGAAFANTIFCKPGARVLTVLNENDLFPTFNDIATVMGLRHRKLTGRPELDDYGVNYLWAPYRIDAKLAERDLRWALGG